MPWTNIPFNPLDNQIKPDGPTLNGEPIVFNTDVNAPENKEFMEEAVRAWDEEE